MPGTHSVVYSDHIRQLADELPAFRGLLVKYEQFFLAQVQQTAACNALHDVQSRTCKWLLRMQELAGDELPLTQEFLAQMMGVRRSTVTEVASELQKNAADFVRPRPYSHQGYRAYLGTGMRMRRRYPVPLSPHISLERSGRGALKTSYLRLETG